MGTDPLEEVEDQRLYGFGRRFHVRAWMSECVRTTMIGNRGRAVIGVDGHNQQVKG